MHNQTVRSGLRLLIAIALVLSACGQATTAGSDARPVAAAPSAEEEVQLEVLQLF